MEIVDATWATLVSGLVAGQYDVVFAKGRSAIEALACGCAVVVADYSRFAGLVTTKTLDHLRTELLIGGSIVFVTGTATVWLILIKRAKGGMEAWTVTP